jgi:hypothetical protein
MKKIILALALTTAALPALAVPVQPYPVNGEDCYGDRQTVVAVNRFFSAVCSKTVCHILDWTASTKFNFNDGAMFGNGAIVSYEGTADNFTCMAKDIEVFSK